MVHCILTLSLRCELLISWSDSLAAGAAHSLMALVCATASPPAPAEPPRPQGQARGPREDVRRQQGGLAAGIGAGLVAGALAKGFARLRRGAAAQSTMAGRRCCEGVRRRWRCRYEGDPDRTWNGHGEQRLFDRRTSVRVCDEGLERANSRCIRRPTPIHEVEHRMATSIVIRTTHI